MERVYFVKGGDFVKIGWSKDPEARVSGLATGNPYPLELLGSIRGTQEDERALHGAFASLRANGEWFRAEPALMGLVTWLIAREPTFEARELVEKAAAEITRLEKERDARDAEVAELTGVLHQLADVLAKAGIYRDLPRSKHPWRQPEA